MTTRTARKPSTGKKTTARTPRRRSIWQRFCAGLGKLGGFLMQRSRDIALLAIVGGAFVAVFDGSLYSATKFSFIGVSAIAFALMPDALMVIATAKMRQANIHKEQWFTARRWMRVSLVFSLLTNVNAAFMRNAPEMITKEYLLVGAMIYHGMIVIFLWGAMETLTKVRADRKATKAFEAPASTAAPSAAATPVAPQAIPVHARPVGWLDTGLAWLVNGKQPQA